MISVRLRPAAVSSNARSMIESSASRPTNLSSRRGTTSYSASRRSRHRLAASSNAEFAAQCAVHTLELSQGRVTIAVGRVAAHESEMRELVTRVELDHCVPPTIEAQQVEMAQTQLFAPLFGPRFVAVLRE